MAAWSAATADRSAVVIFEILDRLNQVVERLANRGLRHVGAGEQIVEVRLGLRGRAGAGDSGHKFTDCFLQILRIDPEPGARDALGVVGQTGNINDGNPGFCSQTL